MTPALDTMRQDNKTSVSDLMPARSLVRDNEIMRNTLSSTGRRHAPRTVVRREYSTC